MNSHGTSWLGPTLLQALLVICIGCDSGQSTNPGTNALSSTAAPTPVTNMIFIKAGTFLRKNELITVSQDFWIGKFEVTQAEYSALMGRNPSHFKDCPDCPVEKVSLNEALAYCSAMTVRERNAGRLPAGFEYRLPWEIEWEYACLAGSTNRFAFGQSPDEADPHAWTAENSSTKTHAVGQKRPNAWGLYDMHGNVWEWCLDTFKPEPGKPAPPNAQKYKIFKGGGWNQDAEFAGAANRFMMSPSNGIHFVGFRIVLAPLPPATSP